jgi:hypothetical protein
MHITNTLRPALIAGALMTTIFAAPMAMATPALLKACVVTGAGSRCQWPGNVEITNPQPVIDYYPYGTMPFLVGGH